MIFLAFRPLLNPVNSPLAPRASGCHASHEIMAKPNYQFEKRRRELDKKAKKAEKLRLKAEAARTPGEETTGDVPPASAQSADAA